MRIYNLRHCESGVMKWRMENPDALEIAPSLLPDFDVPLSELGDEQSEALALYFASLPPHLQPTIALSSPYRRAVQTGTKAVSGLVVPVSLQLDARLGEIEFGIFAGLTKKGRAAKFPSEWAERHRVGKINFRPVGGENWHDVRDRLDPFTQERIKSLPLDAVVLISGHEVVVNVFRWLWEGGDPVELSNLGAPSASITSYDYDGTNFTLVEKYKLPPSPTGKDLFSMESKTE